MSQSLIGKAISHALIDIIASHAISVPSPLNIRIGFLNLVAGVDASTIIYSLMLICRACDVDPHVYLLRHVLTELPQCNAGGYVANLLLLNYTSC